MIQLIASDMDGTLVNGQLEISDENAAAIKAAQQQGILFCIATGRDYREASTPLKEKGIICPIITLNGAHLFDKNGKTIDFTAIEKPTTHKLWNILEQKGIYAELMTNQGVFAKDEGQRLHYFIDYIGETMPHLTHQQALEMAHTYLEYFHLNPVEDVRALIDREEIHVLKFFAVSEKLEALKAVAKQIEVEFPELVITSSGSYNIEINHKNAQKGIAIQKLAEKYGIDSTKVMALGDSLNDASMIRLAKIGVAMENATDEIKQLATHHTTSNEDSGVAKAIWNVLDGKWSE